MSTLSNVETPGVEANTPSISVVSDAIPQAVNTQNGVSVEYVHEPEKQWFVFRASYGREDKASDFLVADGTFTYIAKRDTFRYVNGKRPEESAIDGINKGDGQLHPCHHQPQRASAVC